ncbi:Rna-Binding Protein 6 [Manis pentadactyla]|nr:Rna-Binding Protein 6 [Manis pentadactyla]
MRSAAMVALLETSNHVGVWRKRGWSLTTVLIGCPDSRCRSMLAKGMTMEWPAKGLPPEDPWLLVQSQPAVQCLGILRRRN